MAYLNEWDKIETEHNLALSGAIEDLKSSTLRLPVTGGATVCDFLVKCLNMQICYKFYKITVEL